MPSFHAVLSHTSFADVILPLAIPGTYTYAVPDELVSEVTMGKRVEVQFGRGKLYSGVVRDVHRNRPEGYEPREILSVIDAEPVVLPWQLQLWEWMAEYYACTLGELMLAALPARFKLTGETRITINPDFQEDHEGFREKEYLVAEALQHHAYMTLKDIQKLLGQKTVYPLIQKMLDQRMIHVYEELKDRYVPKKVGCVRLSEPYRSDPDQLESAFALVEKAPRQLEALLAFIQIGRSQAVIKRQDLVRMAGADSTVLRAMEKKGIVELYELEVSRLSEGDQSVAEAPPLSDQQKQALVEVHHAFQAGKPVLLHGVTGSGKTRVYMELIREALNRDEQVLYMVPEIALTAQLVNRLREVFGDAVGVYHSRINDNERIELWNAALNGKPMVMGARSSLFLPFRRLKLIIIDEEHDASYKQQDPAPRYNARDVGVYLANRLRANVVLGTATPSLESYFNCTKARYHLVEMTERYGQATLPDMQLVDMREELKKRTMQSHFTLVLLTAIETALEARKQIILFQNRRGFSPAIQCQTCGWQMECVNCDVTLTYHKYSRNMRCHYCAYSTGVPEACPACGVTPLTLRGFGTEKIEDELAIFFPKATIARMDLDTVRGKNAYATLIQRFAEGSIDMLVGTQMVTKGLDFDNVSVVGVLSADHLLQFPDFRATERTFQLITQVAGRAGRKKDKGTVIIQAFNPTQPVLAEVLAGNYKAFFQREIAERQEFHYPPFCRLITLTLKHKNPNILDDGAKLLFHYIQESLGQYLLGPSVPPVPRVRNQYLMQMLFKLPNTLSVLKATKTQLRDAIRQMQSAKGLSGVRVNVDVDPS